MISSSRLVRKKQYCDSIRDEDEHRPVVSMSDLQGGLIITLARWRLELSSPQELVDEASTLLNIGADSQALRELAGLVGREVTDASALFHRVILDLDLPNLTRRDAALILARQIAEAIVNQMADPFEGARTIWTQLAAQVPEAREELLGFVGLASEWQDQPAHRTEYQRAIVEEARQFLERTADVGG